MAVKEIGFEGKPITNIQEIIYITPKKIIKNIDKK